MLTIASRVEVKPLSAGLCSWTVWRMYSKNRLLRRVKWGRNDPRSKIKLKSSMNTKPNVNLVEFLLFFFVFFCFFPFQKCLDKDPAKRWSCERLLGHPLFEDYLAKHKDDTAVHSDPYKTNRSRDKSKVFKHNWYNPQIILNLNCICFFSHRTHRCRWSSMCKIWTQTPKWCRNYIRLSQLNIICRQFKEACTFQILFYWSLHQNALLFKIPKEIYLFF